MFFTSYSLLDKLEKRWKQTGAWQSMELTKALMVESRGSDKVGLLLFKYNPALSLSVSFRCHTEEIL